MATNGAIGHLEALLDQITKRADNDPGGYQGPSTHPSANVKDDTMPGRTGSRAAENERDVKNSREKPSVDATPDAKAQSGSGDQDEHQLNIGTEQSATGEDPSVEDDFKGDKEDPGTTSVMKADDGEKYGSFLAMPTLKLAEHATKLHNQLLAHVVQKGASAAPATTNTTTKEAAAAAAAQGYADAAAASFDQNDVNEGYQLVEQTMKEASVTAELIYDFLVDTSNAIAASYKQADAVDGDPENPHAHGGHEGGGPPPADGPPGGAPAGGPPGGGNPMALAATGGDAPQPSPDEALHELAAALLEMGIDPKELATVAEQMMGGAGGPGGGPPPPEKAAMASQVKEAATRVATLKRAGKFNFGAPRNDKLAALRGEMKTMVREFLA